MSMIGKKLTVYIESEDGSIAEFPCVAVQASTEIDSENMSSTTITLVSSGNINWNSLAKVQEKIDSVHYDGEWRCLYCDSINDLRDKKCSQCGAYRSFIYDI